MFREDIVEKLRKEMIKLIETKGTSHEETINKSQELDTEIVKYYI